MSETNALLEALETGTINTTPVFNIDPVTRIIDIPENFLLGVESDEESQRLDFICPKIVGNGIDLSTLELRINYKNENSPVRYDECENVSVSTDFPDKLTFSWIPSREVTEFKGITKFTVCAIKRNGVEVTNEWNTIPATGIVAEGLEPEGAGDGGTIVIVQGSAFSADLKITNDDGTEYIPESGDTIEFGVKQNSTDTSYLIVKQISTNDLKLNLYPADTQSLAPGDYIYRIELTKATGEVLTIINESRLRILQEVI